MQYMIIGSGGPVIVTLTGSTYSSASASSHSISVATGPMFERKHVVCIVHYEASGGPSISSATLGGTSAPIMRQDRWDPTSINFGVAILGLRVTSSAASQTLALSCSGSTIINNVGVYAVKNLRSITPVSTDGGATALSGSIPSYTRTVSVTKGGVVFAGIKGFNANPYTFTAGVTEDYNNPSEQGVGGHSLIAGDNASYNVTYTRDGAPSNYFPMSVVSLR